MAIVIKNTFLDISEHKFLNLDVIEPCSSIRRSRSIPWEWKPAAARGNGSPCKAMLTLPAQSVLQKSSSSLSVAESPKGLSTSAQVDALSLVKGGPSKRSALQLLETVCGDSASSTSSPRSVPLVRRRWRSFSEQLPPTINAGIEKSEDLHDLGSRGESGEDISTVAISTKGAQADAPESTNTSCGESRSLEGSRGRGLPATTKTDIIVNGVFTALSSCRQIRNSEIKKDLPGRYPILILAELCRGSLGAHDVMHLARRALGCVTSNLRAASLLSSRLQREEGGYSLRASVACLPESEEHNVCWDLFRKGHCRRRGQCRWYHPQDRDVVKIKVSIRCVEEDTSKEEDRTAAPPRAVAECSFVRELL